MLPLDMALDGPADRPSVRSFVHFNRARAARASSFINLNRRRSEHCSRSNSPFLNPTPADLEGRCSNSSKPTGILRTVAQDKMSPLSMPTGPSATSTTAAAAAAAVAAAQVHLNGTMQDMINLQKLQSLAQLTGASVLGPSLGLPTSPLLGNSPLNLSLSGQSHSPQVLGLGPAAPIAAAAPQMPQLLLASGQIMQGIQGAQLLIPTSQGIATQTILTIPVGQQVISNMSSEALLQSLNFNNSLSETLSSQAAQAAQAAAAAAAASGGLFAPPRDAQGTGSGGGLLSTQLLGTAAGAHSQQHSPKGLHYANHHHHHHHHHGDVKFKPNALSTSSSSCSSSSQQHHRAPSADDLELEKPSTVGSSSGTVHQLQKRSHHSAASTPPPKLSPAGSTGRLSHSDDDDDDASNHEFLEEHPNELTINQTNCNVVDGIDLDDIKEFAKAFKLRRLSLGLTQTQVGQALSVTEGPAYSQSAICRFEKLDITPKSAQKIKPVLERWMKEAEESHSSRYKSGQNHVPDFIGVEPSKKRKRRTSFTPQALELLNGHFERNTHPSGTEITGLAHQLGYEREVIRIWFCNKRQALKNTVRMMSKSFKMENT
uniref:POU domain protein n=1 Tax=Anopheles melas TaxID=34690 RepID=A0A182TP79_9DIPT